MAEVKWEVQENERLDGDGVGGGTKSSFSGKGHLQ